MQSFDKDLGAVLKDAIQQGNFAPKCVWYLNVLRKNWL